MKNVGINGCDCHTCLWQIRNDKNIWIENNTRINGWGYHSLLTQKYKNKYKDRKIKMWATEYEIAVPTLN